MPYYNVIIHGPSNTGKTALLKRAANNEFTSTYTPTELLEFETIQQTALTGVYPTEFLDAERLRVTEPVAKTFNYSLIAQAHILVADLSLLSPVNAPAAVSAYLSTLAGFLSLIREHNNEKAPIYIVGTKHDSVKIQDMKNKGILDLTMQQLKSFARDHGISEERVFFTSSLLEGEVEDNKNNYFSPLNIFRKIHKAIKSPAAQGLETEVDRDEPAPDASVDDNINNTSPFSIRKFFNFLFGAFFGAIIGAMSGFIIHNPVICFLSAWRAPDWAEWGILNLLRIYVLAPLINPLVATGYGFLRGGVYGAENGITELLQIPRDMAEPFKLRTIITGFALSVLIGGAITVAAIHLLPFALPLILGVAGAATVISFVSYEGIDFLLTHLELQDAIKNKSASKLLLANDEDAPEAQASAALSTRPKIKMSKQNSYLAVNEYAKVNNAGSWRSLFQVAPPKPAASRGRPLSEYSAAIRHIHGSEINRSIK